MNLLVLYGTTEGQTRKIAQFIAQRAAARGWRAGLIDAAQQAPRPEPGDFDAVIVAASLHIGRYQAPVVHYVHDRREALNRMPSAFVSVSLAAASEDEEEREGVETCLRRFLEETGWTPLQTHHAAGAFRFTEYDFFKRLTMRMIARRHGQPPSGDYELTDYEALGAFTDAFLDEAQRRASEHLAIQGQGR